MLLKLYTLQLRPDRRGCHGERGSPLGAGGQEVIRFSALPPRERNGGPEGEAFVSGHTDASWQSGDWTWGHLMSRVPSTTPLLSSSKFMLSMCRYRPDASGGNGEFESYNSSEAADLHLSVSWVGWQQNTGQRAGRSSCLPSWHGSGGDFLFS